MGVIKFLFLLLIALVIGVFGAHNSGMVPVSFYPLNLEIQVAAFILFFAAILLGVLLASLIASIKSLRWRKLVRTKNREIERLEKENAELRAAKLNQPLLSQS